MVAYPYQDVAACTVARCRMVQKGHTESRILEKSGGLERIVF